MTTVYEIPLRATPQIFDIVFPNGNTYFFRIMFLESYENPCWSVDIADANGNALISGMSLVPGADMFEQYGYLNFGCRMFCGTDGDPLAVPTFSNLGSTSHLWIDTTP